MYRKKKKMVDEQKIYVASQWQLMWRKFKKHKLAILGGALLSILYFAAIFCEFISPYSPENARVAYMDASPQRVHFIDANGKLHLRPFVYKLNRIVDMETLDIKYAEDKSQVYPIQFFVHGDKYKLWSIMETDIHLFGVKDGVLFLFGTDKMGRDLFSRCLYAARVSLSIGLIGVFVSFALGCLLGGISGYYGGKLDIIIQRMIELLISLPTIPIWMALAAALPPHWSSVKIYFGITIILSLLGWTQLARVVRGKFIVLKNEDYVLASKLVGAKESFIIVRHLIPAFLSYLIVNLTLAIPRMILGETALSFLGLGLQPPALSWGVLLQDAQAIRSLALKPWLLIPAVFVIITVISFNFVGDGLRDAADPYKQ